MGAWLPVVSLSLLALASGQQLERRLVAFGQLLQLLLTPPPSFSMPVEFKWFA